MAKHQIESKKDSIHVVIITLYAQLTLFLD